MNTETADGDRVTLVSPGSGVWWSTRMPEGREELLEVLEQQEALLFPDTQKDRMSDYEAMRIHVFRDNMIINRITRRYATFGVKTVLEQEMHTRDVMAQYDPYVMGKAAEVYYQSAARNHVTLGAMERALNSLARLQGRKSMILVSEGFVYDTHLAEFKQILTASRHANTAIYFLNSKGLQGLPSMMDAEFSQMRPQEDMGFAFSQEYETSEGSVSLAPDTGGFTVRNNNDLAEGMKRIGDETRAYYLIGYNPTNTDRDGKFRKIEVKIIGRKGVKVRARKGYYAPGGDGQTAEVAEGTDPAFQSAMDSPYALEDIGLRMTHFVREETFLGKARVYVAAEVDVAGLEFQEQEDRETAALQFLMVTIHRESGEFFRYDQKIDLKLKPETREQLTRSWLPIVRDFELEAGHYRAKIVLRDKTSGRFGTVIHDFEVPPIGTFRVSTPVVSDLREPTADGEPGEQLAIMARREFAPQGSLFCQLDVYGAAKLESSGMPKVSMGYEVRRSDGVLYTNEAHSLILPTSIGGISRMIGFPLEYAPEGDYEIVVSVRDELSGRKVEVREPFTVSANAATPPSTAPAPDASGTAPPPASTTSPAATEPTGR